MLRVGNTHKQRAFTIVEILVIIAIIAILATILLTAYNAWTKQALNVVRYDEVKAWDKQFKLYKATYRSYPSMPDGYYCLGNGFPDIDSDGQTDCRDLFPSIPTIEHPSNTLNTELKKVGSLSQGTRKPAGDGYRLGPFVRYNHPSGSIVVMQIFDGNKCPSDMTQEYDYNTQVPDRPNAIICYFVTAR